MGLGERGQSEILPGRCTETLKGIVICAVLASGSRMVAGESGWEHRVYWHFLDFTGRGRRWGFLANCAPISLVGGFTGLVIGPSKGCTLWIGLNSVRNRGQDCDSAFEQV
jgi:hypothetical protein